MKTAEKIIIAALVAVIVIQFYQIGRINKVNDSLIQKTNRLEHEISLIENSMAGRLNNVINMIRQENEVVTAVNWKHENTADGKTNVRCETVLKKLQEGQQPYLLFREMSDAQWDKVELEKTEGLNFVSKLSLDASSEYEYQVFIDGSEKTAAATGRIPQHIYAYADFTVEIQQSRKPDSSQDEVVINLLPRTKTGVEELAIKSAHAWFYSGGKLVDTLEMLPPVQNETQEDTEIKEKGQAVKIKRAEGSFQLFSLRKDLSDFDEPIDCIEVIATYGDGRQREKTVFEAD